MKEEESNFVVKEMTDAEFRSPEVGKLIVALEKSGGVFILQPNKATIPGTPVPIYREVKICQCVVGKPLIVEFYANDVLLNRHYSEKIVDNIFKMPQH